MLDIQDNPYSAILNTLRRDTREHTQDVWCYGIVRGVPPLSIEVSGTLVPASRLSVNTQFLPLTVNGPLQPGDRVILLTADDWQNFIVLCKVVNA